MNQTRLRFVGLLLMALIAATACAPALAHAAPPSQGEDREAKAATLSFEGLMLYGVGEYQAALEKWQAALGIYQEIGDREGEEISLTGIGMVYDDLGQYQEALKYYKQALAINREIGDRASEGGTLISIGRVYRNLRQYHEALKYHQEALEICHEIGNGQCEEYALNDIGVVYDGLGQYQEALEYYEQALVMSREIGERAGEGRALNNIGVVYDDLGQYQESLKYHQEALAIFRELGDRVGEGNSLTSIGKVYKNLGQYQEALNYHQEALEIYRELGDLQWEEYAVNDVGIVHCSLGQHQEALKYLEEALAISREIGDRWGEGHGLNNVGNVYEALGQYQQALKYYEEALAISREISDRAGEMSSLNNIGNVHNRLGQYQEALKYYEEALAISREVGKRVGEGRILNNIGNVYGNLGQYQEALKYHERALAISREIGDRNGEESALGNIGNVYGKLERYLEALTYYQAALAISREIGDRAGEGTAIVNIGIVYMDLGRYQEALKYYEDALAISREVGNRQEEGTNLNNIGIAHEALGRYQEALKYYEDALAISRELGDRQGEADTMHNIGGTYYDAGEKEKALKYYQEALALYEKMRGEMTVEELKITYAETYKSLYERAVALLMELNQPQAAFHYGERARARTLLDQLGNAHIDPRQTDDSALIEQEEALRLEIGALEKSQREEWAKPQAERSDEKVKNLNTQLEEKRAEYAKLLKTLKLKNPEYASLVAVDPLSLEEIQKLLDNATLVEYFVTEEQTFAFVVGKENFQVETIEVKREDLQKTLTAFRDFASLEGMPDEMKSLHDTLFAPVRPHIRTEVLVIAPHGLLHYLPFQALHDGEHYLVEEYTISYIPSASVLPFALEKRKEEPNIGSALVLGNPAVEGAPPLAYAKKEAQEVADLYGATARYEDEATETLFRSEAGQAGLVHLACHGEYNPYVPLFSRLLLAADGEHDGSLNVHELYNVELPQADLVTLSACQTNVGQVSEGDEVVGLTRALIYAGAPTIVASLWTVDDVATGELMVSFYKHLKEGKSKAEALRAAQVEMLGKEGYAHPYYWAAFVLSGDPGEMTGYESPARETATPHPFAEATIAPVEETPKVGETPAPAEGGRPCPAGALILALGVGVAFIANGRRHYV